MQMGTLLILNIGRIKTVDFKVFERFKFQRSNISTVITRISQASNLVAEYCSFTFHWRGDLILDSSTFHVL